MAAIILLQATPSLLQEVASVATAVGALVAATALFFTARGVRSNVDANERNVEEQRRNVEEQRKNGKVQEATFWLELRRMLESYDTLHRELQKDGKWCESNTEPSTPQERARIIPYLGLLEQCKIMLDEGLLSEPIFNKTLRYRVRLILQNGPIKRDILKVERKDEEKFWPTFKKLATDLGYRQMLENPKGGKWKDLNA